MAGLGLSNAVGDAIDIYRSGKRQTADDAYRADERKYQGEQRARATMMQGRDDAAYALDQKANDAARQALQSVQQPQGLAMPGAEMPAGQDGQPGLAMPTQAQAAPRKLMPADYLKAFDAQASVYAGAGDVNKLMESEAKAYPLRTQVRNEGLGQALSDYKSHQDPIKLAQAAYPLLRDGNEITGAKNLGGTIEFTLSNGTKQVVKPEQVAEQIQYAMLNPQKVAEMEMGARIEAMKAEAKGKEDRLTLGVKQTGDMGIETLKQSGALGLADVNNKASLDRTMQQGKNSLAVAGIGLSPRRFAA